jgi:hypothetical protein
VPEEGSKSSKKKEQGPQAEATAAELKQAGDRHEGVSDDLDAGQAEVQARFDEINEKGFVGQTVDPTPPENYSTQTPDDAPTPETDNDLFDEGREAAIGRPREAVDRSAAEIAADKKK